MKTYTWVNSAGMPMAIAETDLDACALWQSGGVSAYSSDFNKMCKVYKPEHAQRIVSPMEALAYARDTNAPGFNTVMRAVKRRQLWEYQS